MKILFVSQDLSKMITEEEVKAKIPEKYWRRIIFSTPDKCWDWTGGKTGNGYAYMKGSTKKARKNLRISRLMYEWIFGDFDKKLFVLHHCDRPICVNPNCLWLGTHQDNMDDMNRKGRGKIVHHKGSKNGKAKLTEEQVVLIKLRLSVGESQRKLSKIFGVDQNIIWLIKRRKLWKHVNIEGDVEEKIANRVGCLKGEDHRSSKLTGSDVIKIRTDFKNGIPQYKLADEFNVNRSAINKIVHRRLWAHIS